MSPPEIRPIEPADLPHILPMIQALAAHHGDTPMIDLASLERDALGSHPWLTVLVAQGPEGLSGYAALCPLAQLQFGVRGMDMHHLFVAADQRGQGIGKALIDASLREAVRQGCRYIMVGTHPDNHRAQAIYQQAGFDARPPAGPRFAMKL